jgi:hypothetical protein
MWEWQATVEGEAAAAHAGEIEALERQRADWQSRADALAGEALRVRTLDPQPSTLDPRP